MASSSEPSAATTNEQERRDLRDYVTGWIKHKEPVDPVELARLVAAAPAKQTLDDYEWWNVALLCAQEITYDLRRRDDAGA